MVTVSPGRQVKGGPCPPCEDWHEVDASGGGETGGKGLTPDKGSREVSESTSNPAGKTGPSGPGKPRQGGVCRWHAGSLTVCRSGGIPSVSLRRLLPEARFVGCPDWEVSGCTDDHRRLDPGQVFVATRGPHYDGHAFIREALDRAQPAWWWNSPAPRRAGSRWSSTTPGPPTPGSARPSPATRPSSSPCWA